jgi:GWxTD domain-containing protein
MAAAAPQKSAAKMLPGPYRKWLLEDVAYIITDQERTAFVALTSDAEREDFIQQFWERRDPTPGTQENEFRDEHYRRIAYTNEHFSAGVAGWKTDRGRTYIVYGPPDEIDDHSTSRPATQQWRYRYIDGVGTNILVDFVDQHGTGDFQMTADLSSELSPAYRKWLNEDAAYIISDEERTAFRKLTTDPERDKFIAQFWQQRGPAFKTEHYRRIAYANENFTTGIPGWKTDRGRVYIMYGPPDTITSLNGRTIEWAYGHIDGMGNNITVSFTDRNGDGEYRMTKDPGERQNVPPEEAAVARQVEALQKRLAEVSRQLADAQAGLTTRQSVDQLTQLRTQLQLAKEEYQAGAKDGQESWLSQQAKEKLAAAQEQLMSQETAQARESELQSAQAQLKQLAEKQHQENALLSAQKSLKLQMEALAESLEPLQPGATFGVRVKQTGPQTVTAHVPLDSPRDRYYVLEQVRTPDGRIVHMSAGDPTGAEFSRSVFLAPGKYRLVTVVKNQASGATWRAYVDFEVN